MDNNEYDIDSIINEWKDKPQAEKPEKPATFASEVGRGVKDIGVGLLKGGLGIGQSAVGLADLATGGAVGEGLSKVGYDSARTNEAINQLHSPEYLQGQRNVQEAGEYGSNEFEKGVSTLGALVANPMQAVGSVAESAPLMLPGMAWQAKIAERAATAGKAASLAESGLATTSPKIAAGAPISAADLAANQAAQKAAGAAVTQAMPKIIAAGAAMEGAQQAGMLADEQQNAGKSWNDYVAPAVASGVLDATIATASGALFGDVLTKLLTKGVTQEAAQAQAKSAAMRFLQGAATEGLAEELPQSIQEKYFENLANKEQDLWKGTGAAGAQGLVAGGLMGGAMNVGALSKAASAGGLDVQPTVTPTPPQITPEQRQADLTTQQTQWTPPSENTVIDIDGIKHTSAEAAAKGVDANESYKLQTPQHAVEVPELPTIKHANDLYNELISDTTTSATLSPKQAESVVNAHLEEAKKPVEQRQALPLPQVASEDVQKVSQFGSQSAAAQQAAQNTQQSIDSLKAQHASLLLHPEINSNPDVRKQVNAVKKLIDGQIATIADQKNLAVESSKAQQDSVNNLAQNNQQIVYSTQDYKAAVQSAKANSGRIESDGKQYFVVAPFQQTEAQDQTQLANDEIQGLLDSRANDSVVEVNNYESRGLRVVNPTGVSKQEATTAFNNLNSANKKPGVVSYEIVKDKSGAYHVIERNKEKSEKARLKTIQDAENARLQAEKLAEAKENLTKAQYDLITEAENYFNRLKTLSPDGLQASPETIAGFGDELYNILIDVEQGVKYTSLKSLEARLKIYAKNIVYSVFPVGSNLIVNGDMTVKGVSFNGALNEFFISTVNSKGIKKDISFFEVNRVNAISPEPSKYSDKDKTKEKRSLLNVIPNAPVGGVTEGLFKELIDGADIQNLQAKVTLGRSAKKNRAPLINDYGVANPEELLSVLSSIGFQFNSFEELQNVFVRELNDKNDAFFGNESEIEALQKQIEQEFYEAEKQRLENEFNNTIEGSAERNAVLKEHNELQNQATTEKPIETPEQTTDVQSENQTKASAETEAVITPSDLEFLNSLNENKAIPEQLPQSQSSAEKNQTAFDRLTPEQKQVMLDNQIFVKNPRPRKEVEAAGIRWTALVLNPVLARQLKEKEIGYLMQAVKQYGVEDGNTTKQVFRGLGYSETHVTAMDILFNAMAEQAKSRVSNEYIIKAAIKRLATTLNQEGGISKADYDKLFSEKPDRNLANEALIDELEKQALDLKLGSYQEPKPGKNWLDVQVQPLNKERGRLNAEAIDTVNSIGSIDDLLAQINKSRQEIGTIKQTLNKLKDIFYRIFKSKKDVQYRNLEQPIKFVSNDKSTMFIIKKAPMSFVFSENLTGNRLEMANDLKARIEALKQKDTHKEAKVTGLKERNEAGKVITFKLNPDLLSGNKMLKLNNAASNLAGREAPIFKGFESFDKSILSSLVDLAGLKTYLQMSLDNPSLSRAERLSYSEQLHSASRDFNDLMGIIAKSSYGNVVDEMAKYWGRYDNSVKGLLEQQEPELPEVKPFTPPELKTPPQTSGTQYPDQATSEFAYNANDLPKIKILKGKLRLAYKKSRNAKGDDVKKWSEKIRVLRAELEVEQSKELRNPYDSNEERELAIDRLLNQASQSEYYEVASIRRDEIEDAAKHGASEQEISDALDNNDADAFYDLANEYYKKSGGKVFGFGERSIAEATRTERRKLTPKEELALKINTAEGISSLTDSQFAEVMKLAGIKKPSAKAVQSTGYTEKELYFIRFFELAVGDRYKLIKSWIDAGGLKQAEQNQPTPAQPQATEQPQAGVVEVSKNTIFTDDMAEAARQRIKSRLGRLNAGVDPEMFADGIVLAGYHIEKGARSFAAYAKAMVADMGEEIKPYLKQFYYGVKADPRAESFASEMDKLGLVEDADIEEILAEPKTKSQKLKQAIVDKTGIPSDKLTVTSITDAEKIPVQPDVLETAKTDDIVKSIDLMLEKGTNSQGEKLTKAEKDALWDMRRDAIDQQRIDKIKADYQESKQPESKPTTLADFKTQLFNNGTVTAPNGDIYTLNRDDRTGYSYSIDNGSYTVENGGGYPAIWGKNEAVNDAANEVGGQFEQPETTNEKPTESQFTPTHTVEDDGVQVPVAKNKDGEFESASGIVYEEDALNEFIPIEDINNENNTRKPEVSSRNVSVKADKPRVPTEKQGLPNKTRTEKSGKRVHKGQGELFETDLVESWSNELPANEPVVGQQTDVGTEQPIEWETGDNGSVSKLVGANNYSLENSPNIVLTPAKRRDLNAQAEAILNKPVNEITEADKNILRQYTGVGGLSAKDSQDKGEGVFNQHFTNYDTIKAMYNALDAAGIKFNYVLEPSVGSGNFIGLHPLAEWVAVDIDKTNTEIVKRLYPDAVVHNQSYEDFGGKDFDLIISNVPFASFSELPRAKANLVKPAFKAIHNFFFAQSVDKLKDGGVMAFMTSTGTMDGATEAKKLREYIVKNMDVIGAFRLPSGTQKANASTDVMIDIIFLQKRPEGVESKQADKNQSFVNIGSKEGFKINQYFLDNPESVLGKLEVGTKYTPAGQVPALVVSGEPQYENIKLEPQDYGSSKRAKESDLVIHNMYGAMDYAKEHGYKFINEKITQPFYKDGYIYDMPFNYTRSTDGGIFGRQAVGTQADKIKALQAIDDTLQIDMGAAAQLVADYETKYGKSPHNDKALQLWAKGNHVAKTLKYFEALFDKDFNLSERFTKKVRFKDSGKIEVTPESPLIDRAESLEDADGIIILDKATHLLSNADIQDLLDSGDYARTDSNGIQNSRLYYAGNIYHKIDALDRVSPKAQRDKQAVKLEAVKPVQIPLSHITITGKESWIYSNHEAMASIGITYGADDLLKISSDTIDDGYHRDLMQRYLNNEPLVKKQKDETPEEYSGRVKQAQETLSTEVLPLIKQKLIDDGLSDTIVDFYNRSKNFFTAPVFDGSSLKNLPKTFKGKPFKLMQHQQEGAERAIYNKKGVIAFAPGLGKTPTAIIVAWELLNKGVMKKPLFIVPANTIHQWEASTRSLYPNANVFEFPKYTNGVRKGEAKEWQNLTAADKERMVHDLANNQYDYTFISTNLATKFTIPENKMKQYIDDLTESISSMELPDEDLTKSQIKAKLKRIAKLNMLKETMMAAFNNDAASGFDMEKMGFDAIFADEVQYYKNIGVQSGDAKGGIGANVELKAKYPMIKDENGNDSLVPDTDADPLSVSLGSARSYDFRFKTMYISENNNGNNIFLLTGTPTPNKPLELLTLLQHLDTHILDEYGINSVGDFVNEFLTIAEVETTGIDGNTKMESQLVEIKNIDGLKKIISRYVDYRSPESAGDLVRPKQIDVIHTILKNDDADLVFADLQARILQSIEDAKAAMSGNIDEDAEKIIVMYGAGRDASIDVRLYKSSAKSTLVPIGMTFEEEVRADYSKIAKTVQLVKEQLERQPESGQLIFLDRLKYPQGGSTHESIRDKVIAATGLTANQVVYVNGGEHVNPATGKIVKSSPDAKRLQEVMDAYNSGKIKVLIGNTTKLGVGVDLQVHSTDVYQIDKPYRPDEVEQRTNRAVRQGNRHAEVRVHYFHQAGTFDAMSDRILANKQGFNDVFWKDQSSDRADIAAEAPPSQYDAAIELEQNPLKRRKLEIERDLYQARNIQTNIEKQVSNLAKRIRSAQHNIDTFTTANNGIDTRETPAYEDQSPAERAKSIKAFKERLAAQKVKNLDKIASFKDDLVKLESDKAGRIAELEQHKSTVNELKSKYVVDGVVSIDNIKQYDNIQFSKTTPPQSAHTTTSLTRAFKTQLDKHFGSGWSDRLFATGKFEIKTLEQAQAANPELNLDGVQGFYDPKTDKTVFIADNISKDKNLVGLALHEIGVHAMTIGKTSAEYQDIIENLLKSQNRPAVKKAIDTALKSFGITEIPKAGKPIDGVTREQVAHEIGAYLVEQNSSLDIVKRIKAFFKTMLRKIGKSLPMVERAKWFKSIAQITEDDIIQMATSALRYAPESLLFDGVDRTTQGAMLSNEQKAARFYSALRKGVEKAPNQAFAGAQQFKLWLAGNAPKMDIKKDEIYWSGINDWLDMQGKTKVTRDDVLNFLDENGVKVEDVVLGENIKTFDFVKTTEKDDYGFFKWNVINTKTGDILHKGLSRDRAEIISETANRNAVTSKHNTDKLTLPNGKNYRELVVTIPAVESWNASDATHFGDVSNGRAISWIRTNERSDNKGNNGLFLEEVQSQRVAQGKESGFNRNLYTKEEIAKAKELIRQLEKSKESIMDSVKILHEEKQDGWREKSKKLLDDYDNLNAEIAKHEVVVKGIGKAIDTGVPPAPFITNANNKATDAYILLLMKKAVSAAIDSGQSFVSWATGEQQADRYNLSKSVDYLSWTNWDSAGEGFGILIGSKDDKEIIKEQFHVSKLPDYIGKELAEKLLSQEKDFAGRRELDGSNLKTQPAWTKTMYGNSQGLDGNGKPSLILQAASELSRKFGGKTGTVSLSTGEQPALFITPEMRAKILNEGMPLFSYAGQRAANADKSDLTRAVEMEQKGIDNETIRKETGWFLGMDDKWRFEIDDSKIELTKPFNKDGEWGDTRYDFSQSVGGKFTTLSDILVANDVFENYPQLKDIKVGVDIGNNEDGGAYYDDERNFIGISKNTKNSKIKRTLLHEMQHIIQRQEGFARGGNPQEEGLIEMGFESSEDWESTMRKLESDRRYWQRKVEEINRKPRYKGQSNDFKNAVAEERRISDEIKKVSTYDARKAFENYERLAGEIEARDTQARMGMTAEQRRESTPYVSQGIPKEDAIVRFGSGIAESRTEQPNLTQLFTDLDPYSKEKGAKAKRARAILSLRGNPNKERIMYISNNLMDLIGKLEKVNGFEIKC